MLEPRGQNLVDRYRGHYHITDDFPLTEEMALKHWELEKKLRLELLESTPDNRWEVFEEAYSRLYSEIDWLNRFSDNPKSRSPAATYRVWPDIIGSQPLTIYEIGSGQGNLIRYLASLGFTCKGTEITRERGKKWAEPHPNLTWGTTDGIHLDQFEPGQLYEVIISDQVIEHLHPDDLILHFKNAWRLLVSGGRYIFSTPHRAAGPSDVSSIFQRDTPLGMHLKEYTYSELVDCLREAGFKRIYSVLRFPARIQQRLGQGAKARASQPYLSYLRLIEKFVVAIPNRRLRNSVSRKAKLILFAPNIMMVAEKG